MNFEELLEQIPSKETLKIIAQAVVNDPSSMQSLWKLAKDNHKISWRAAWLMDKVYNMKPELVRPLIPEMIEIVDQLKSEGQQRQFLKLISMEPLPEEISGNFLDLCFTLMGSTQTPVAIRVYAMQILYNISLRVPDIQHEIACIIEDQMDRGTPGFQSRGKKILKAMRL